MKSKWDKRPCIYCGKRKKQHNIKNRCLDDDDETPKIRILETSYKPITCTVRLYRAIVGALFGPESHSKERYTLTKDETNHDDEDSAGMEMIQREIDNY